MKRWMWSSLAALLVIATGVTLVALPKGQEWTTSSPEALAEFEAQRATRALSESEAVSEFLIGLFEVSDPRQARGESITARELHQKPHGTRVRACGLITMRQRPMTASGTLFLTLEDETGYVNTVIWPRLFEKQRAEILGATLLAVDGVMETDGEVHHLIAERVHDFSDLGTGLRNHSRDFC